MVFRRNKQTNKQTNKRNKEATTEIQKRRKNITMDVFNHPGILYNTQRLQ